MRYGRGIAFAFCLIALGLGAGPVAHASRIDVDQIGHLPANLFDEGNGLPDPTVTTVAPAPDGHVWVGTMRGLARFNGVRMLPIAGPDGKLGGTVRDVVVTPDGRVWVSITGTGVFVLEGGVWREIGDGLGATHALRLRRFVDAGGYRLFATTVGGVHEWVEGRWVARPLPALLAGVEIFDVALEPGRNEALWVASFGQGLYRCPREGDCEPVVPDVDGPRFFEVSSVATWAEAEQGHSVWIGSYGGGVARLKDGRWQRFHQDNGALASNYVHALALQDIGQPQPQVWVGLREGAARLRGSRWESLEYLSRLAGTRTRALALGSDAQGRPQMWLGTDSGAARLRLEGNWRTVSQLGRRGNGVWATLFETGVDGSERLWLGSDGEGLARFDGDGWRYWTQADGLPSPTVRSLARVPDGSAEGQLWAGTWNGHIVRMVGERLQELPTPWRKFEREAVASLLPVGRNEVWVGLRQGGVAHYVDGRWRHFDPADPANPMRVVSLLQTGSGADTVLWASTIGRGLAALRDGRWHFYGREQGLPDDSFFDITPLVDAGGRQVLWLGSQSNGIVRVDITNPQRPRLVTEPVLPEPPHPYTYGIVRDGAGDLILCTDYGAARWRPLPDGRFDVLRFQRSDGLPHDECNAGALEVDAQGRVWAGTIGGAAVYLPRTPTRSPVPPPLQLERVTVDEQDWGEDFAGQPVVLPVGTRSLLVEFALLSGQREGLNRYRSWLEGLEPAPGEWNDTPMRQYTGLPPGDYRLTIEARDYSGTEAPPLVLAFRIPLPAWRSGPALAIYAVMLLLALWGLIRLRERHLHARETELVDLVRQRTDELESRGIELRRANEELTRLSYFDALTELANRRRLLERLQAEWTIGLARGTPVAFALFDLDEFKAYNDHKGHLAGDEALRVVARRVEAELRKPHDTAGRYGGEEFGMVLPGLDLADAMAVAERVRQAVLHTDLPHPGSRLGTVTVSIGVAAIVPRAGLSPDLLVAAADAALYRAKQSGKNRVEAAETLE
ncbi:diguanylate cyclase [Arenimonas sp. MALMAid1274]|uniref:diguanylate cyclase n=1 Tax=Arenimonas sp. MALMAid1274 TaxID=3411630 RepID=UPI003BA1B112